MLLREKNNLAVPGELAARARFFALWDIWRRIFPGSATQVHQNPTAPRASTLDPRGCSPELHGLIVTLGAVGKRILANNVLNLWTKWLVCVSVGLLVVAVIASQISAAVFFVAVMGVVGAAVVLAWSWRTRLSAYEAARRLDAAAGLHDRISTAVYLAGVGDQDGMVREQRRDALVRLTQVDSRGLFPVRFPDNIAGALVLLLVTAGLFAYRMNHKPPLISLLQSTARSQLVQSIFSPIVHAMEKDLQRTIALVTMKSDAAGDEARRSDSASVGDDLWKTNDDKGADAQEKQQESAEMGAGDQPQDQLQSPGSQEGTPTGEPRQQDGNAQSQEGKTGNDGAAGKSDQQSEQQGPAGRQSLGQSLMQALKNMLSNSPNQQANNRAGQQPPNGQGTPQSGNSQQPGATESDKRGESRGNSDAKQKATQTASEGAGSQQGSKDLRADPELHSVNAVPDRVALDSSGFKEDTRMKIATETGTAQLAMRDQPPQGGAVINGAEQENIPARYRFYVQRYFEHVDTAKH